MGISRFAIAVAITVAPALAQAQDIPQQPTSQPGSNKTIIEPDAITQSIDFDRVTDDELQTPKTGVAAMLAKQWQSEISAASGAKVFVQIRYQVLNTQMGPYVLSMMPTGPSCDETTCLYRVTKVDPSYVPSKQSELRGCSSAKLQVRAGELFICDTAVDLPN